MQGVSEVLRNEQCNRNLPKVNLYQPTLQDIRLIKKTDAVLQERLLSIPRQWLYFKRSTAIPLLLHELLRSEAGTITSLLKAVCRECVTLCQSSHFFLSVFPFTICEMFCVFTHLTNSAMNLKRSEPAMSSQKRQPQDGRCVSGSPFGPHRNNDWCKADLMLWPQGRLWVSYRSLLWC